MKKLNEIEMNDTGRTEVEKYVEAFMKLLQDGTSTISVSGKQSAGATSIFEPMSQYDEVK